MHPPRNVARAIGQTVMLLVFTSALSAARGAAAGPVVGTPAVGEVTVEALLDTTFESAAPHGTPALVLFAQTSIPPGRRLTYPPGFVTPSTYFAYVQEGSYAVSAEWPLLVVRGGSDGAPEPPEPVPPQTEVVLNAGDAFIYPSVPAGAGLGELRNLGQRPLVALVGAVYATYPSGFAAGEEVTVLGSIPGDAWASIASGPVALSLHRITIPSGADLPPCSLAPAEVLAVESGALEFSFVGEGPGAAATGPPIELLSGGSIAGLRPGTGIAIRNPGNESVLLLNLALTSVGAEVATPTASTQVPQRTFERCAQPDPSAGTLARVSRETASQP